MYRPCIYEKNEFWMNIIISKSHIKMDPRAKFTNVINIDVHHISRIHGRYILEKHVFFHIKC